MSQTKVFIQKKTKKKGRKEACQCCMHDFNGAETIFEVLFLLVDARLSTKRHRCTCLSLQYLSFCVEITFFMHSNYKMLQNVQDFV